MGSPQPQTLPSMEPPKDLYAKVLVRLENERAFTQQKRQFLAFLLLSIISAISLVPLFFLLRSASAESGFTQFVSLLFTDGKAALMDWQDFSMTLIESVPALTLGAFLLTVCVFMASLRTVIRDARRMVTFSRLASR